MIAFLGQLLHFLIELGAANILHVCSVHTLTLQVGESLQWCSKILTLTMAAVKEKWASPQWTLGTILGGFLTG